MRARTSRTPKKEQDEEESISRPVRTAGSHPSTVGSSAITAQAAPARPQLGSWGPNGKRAHDGKRCCATNEINSAPAYTVAPRSAPKTVRLSPLVMLVASRQ